VGEVLSLKFKECKFYRGCKISASPLTLPMGLNTVYSYCATCDKSYSPTVSEILRRKVQTSAFYDVFTYRSLILSRHRAAPVTYCMYEV